jgi:hypothetical protein
VNIGGLEGVVVGHAHGEPPGLLVEVGVVSNLCNHPQGV